jgi:hypothetical protein
MAKPGLETRLAQLRTSFASMRRTPFTYFFCPILHIDEDAELCKGHVVAQAFPNTARDWVVQRKDVDNFYGWHFEADFAAILYREGGNPVSVLFDKDLSRLFTLTLTADSELVPHFVTRGKVPDHFTGAEVHGADGEAALVGLKLPPEQAHERANAKWEAWVSKDIRVPALVSLLKAGYLTLFSLLGYRYALSPDGWFLGPAMLGRFFLQNRAGSKQAVLEEARGFFGLAAKMVRPVLKSPVWLAGTITDRKMLACIGSGGHWWALVVFVKTSKQMHAVLLPLTETATAQELFSSFMVNEVAQFTACWARFDGDQWAVDPKVMTIDWPKGKELLE